MPRIVIVDGIGVGTTAQIVGDKLTLGREADNDLPIGDPKSSRYHAEIIREGGVWQLHDLGSSNGTWTDAGRVESLVIADGATFRIGRTYLRFEAGDELAQTDGAQGETGWLDPNRLEGLKSDTDLFRRQLGGTTSQLARHNSYLVLLHQLVERSRAAHSRDELFSLVDDAAAEVLDGDRFAVFLPIEGGWELWPPHERMLRARYGAVPYARSLQSAVRRQREPLLCTLAGDLTPTQSMISAGVRSAMAAPLRIGDDVHAMLYVDRIKGPISGPTVPFTRADLEFLSAVANQLAVCIANLANVARMTAEISRLAPQAKPLQLIGPSLAALDTLASKVAATDQPCFIVGETGTGKDLLARIIHQRSARATRPLQVLTCAGIDPDKLELALVGSAREARPGVIELADQATLLIEEIGELPMAAQASIVRFLDRGEMTRIGDETVRTANVRIIATSSVDLRAVSSAGRVRPDLINRLSAFVFFLPPLVDRHGDVDVLIEHLLAEIGTRLDTPPKRLAPEARTALLRCAWPGNIGQLKQVLERACVVANEAVIYPADLPEIVNQAQAAPRGGGELPITSLAAIERMHILRVLEHCGGNKKAAAEVLEIDRSTLYAKLRQYGLA